MFLHILDNHWLTIQMFNLCDTRSTLFSASLNHCQNTAKLLWQKTLFSGFFPHIEIKLRLHNKHVPDFQGDLAWINLVGVLSTLKPYCGLKTNRLFSILSFERKMQVVFQCTNWFHFFSTGLFSKVELAERSCKGVAWI